MWPRFLRFGFRRPGLSPCVFMKCTHTLHNFPFRRELGLSNGIFPLVLSVCPVFIAFLSLPRAVRPAMMDCYLAYLVWME